MNSMHIIDEGDHHIVLGHQDGHQVTVAKKSLSPEMIKKIQSLPKGGYYADGGVIPESPAPQPEAQPEAPVVPELSEIQKLYNVEAKARGAAPEAMFGEAGEAPQNIDPVALEAAKQQINFESKKAADLEKVKSSAVASQNKMKSALGLPVENVAPQAPQQPALPSNVNLGVAPAAPAQKPEADPYAQFGKAMNAVPAAIEQQGKIQADLAQQQAQQYAAQAQKLQEINDKYQKMQDEALKDYESTKADYANGHIDARRIFHNQSTGSKIATGIGLLLSGMGGGLAGQENMTEKMINKAIDDDIRSQEADLGKKKSLLEANYKRFQDLDVAKAATMNSYKAIAEAMMNQAQMSANSKMSAPMAAEKANKFRLESLDTMQKILQAKALKELSAPQQQPGATQQLGASPAGIPLEQASKHIFARLPKEQQSEAIKELGAVQKIKTTQNALRKMYEDAKGIGALAASLPKSESGARLKAINSNIAQLVMANSKAKGSEFSFDELVRPYQIDRTDTQDEIDTKLNGMLQNLSQGSEPTPLLESLGIDVKGPPVGRRIPNAPKLR